MPQPLTDEQARARIEELEEEERRLRRDESENPGADEGERVAADARRLEELRVELDRLWDYLRQRRALRDAGRDPNEARMRDAGTVEDYLG
jgi:Protein of unknown function (DUF2630)